MFFTIQLLFMFSLGVFGKTIYPAENLDDEPLNLTPLVESGQTEKARKLSAVDPTLFAGVQSHAAYFNVNKTNDWNMFFWFFPVKDANLETTPWIIWLQGGPGASSLFGLFDEIGPIQITNNGTAEKRPITWGNNYSLLFIDNPVGTGFSYTTNDIYAEDENEVGAALLNFIQQFLQVFPELRKAPLFITGESYAGKYIPTFGHYIHHKTDSLPINLRGLAIGDGFTDPPTLLHYSEFSLQVGLTDPEQTQIIKEAEDNARKSWDEGDIENYNYESSKAFELLTSFAEVDVYNYLGTSNDTDTYIDFLSRNDVRSAIHVGNVVFNDSSDTVYNALSKEFYLTVKPWLEELLEYYGVMGYSGQLDVIVAYPLSVHTYRSLKWSGAQKYLEAERTVIRNTDNKNIGYIKEAGNFMEVMVRNAGHMVPADQPAAAKQVIDMFIEKFKQ